MSPDRPEQARAPASARRRAGLITLALAAACHGSAPSTAPAPAPAAPRCPTAPVVATTQPHVDALRGCTALAGLTLRGAEFLDLAPLADLARIDGDFTTGVTFVLGSVRLPALAHVGGAVRVASNLDLTGVYLPLLAHAASVTITDNPALLEVMLPALADVPGGVGFARQPSLELVDLSALTTPDRVSVDGSPRLNLLVGNRSDP